MHIRFFLVITSLVFFLKCNNTQFDLSGYNRYCYFDELIMKGVGKPTKNQLLKKDFVYVKVLNKQINVYYPSKSKEIQYRMLDSLWFAEIKINTDIYAEKNNIKIYSNAKGVVIVQEFFKNLDPINFISIHTLDYYYGLTYDSKVSISNKIFSELLKNFNSEICNYQ